VNEDVNVQSNLPYAYILINKETTIQFLLRQKLITKKADREFPARESFFRRVGTVSIEIILHEIRSIFNELRNNIREAEPDINKCPYQEVGS
jgi:hypothetical protein